MADPFAEFGGQTLDTPPSPGPSLRKPEADPFADFGGSQIPEGQEDQAFAQFGGTTAPQPKPGEEPGVLEAGARGLAQGALFEFADEGEAGARALLQGRDYGNELERIRGEYKAAEKAHPNVTLAANLAGGIGASFIPGVGAIGAVGRGATLGRVAAAGALQGGLTELGRSDKEDVGDTAEDVLKGAAFGGALGTGAHVAMAQGSKILGGLKRMVSSEAKAPTPEIDILKLAEESYGAKREADTKFANAIHDGLQPTDPTDVQRMKEFAYYLENPSTVAPETSKLSEEAASEVLDRRKSQMSQEEFTRSYTNYRELQSFKAVAKGIVKKEPGIVENIRDGLNTVIGGMETARNIDVRTGANISQALLDGTEKINHYQVDLARWIKAKQGINTNLSDTDMRTVYDALDTGDLSKVPKELQSTVKDWKTFFSDAADYAKELGVPVQKMENYVPKKMVQMPEAIVKIKKKIAELGGEESVMANLGSKETAELERAVSYFNGGASLSGDPAAFSKKLAEMVQPGSDAFLKEKVASALFRREDVLPPFLQQTDLRQLSNGWLMESLRYGHMKDTLDNLGHQRDLLKVAGAESDVKWLDNLVNDYLGGARGLAKVTRNGTAYLQVKALEAADAAKPGTLSHSIYKYAAETPDALQNLVLNVYPNFLGLSPRAMVQNVAGGFYTMMPELGMTYGAQRGTEAYARAIKNMAKGPKAYFGELEKAGFIAPQWTTDLKDALKQGKPATGVAGKLRKGSEAMSDFAMKGFEYSEKINRAVAWETGKLLTKDLMNAGTSAASKSARNLLETMPPALSKKVKFQIASGDDQAAEKLITKYFADRTLFSYNRLTQSELARAAGPLFSMFTKFPTTILGQVANPLRERGAVDGGGQVMRKLMGPYLAGTLLNELVFDENGRDRLTGNNTEEYLFGKAPPNKKFGTGIASSSPVGAIGSVVGGRVFAPPAIGTAKELVSSVLEGDEERLKRWASGTAQAFAPGGAAAYYKFIKQHAEIAGLIEKDDK